MINRLWYSSRVVVGYLGSKEFFVECSRAPIYPLFLLPGLGPDPLLIFSSPSRSVVVVEGPEPDVHDGARCRLPSVVGEIFLCRCRRLGFWCQSPRTPQSPDDL